MQGLPPGCHNLELRSPDLLEIRSHTSTTPLASSRGGSCMSTGHRGALLSLATDGAQRATFISLRSSRISSKPSISPVVEHKAYPEFRIETAIESAIESDDATAESDQGIAIHDIVAAVANCTNTVLGAGALAVPAAMSFAGIGLYELLLTFIFGVSFISLRWLVAVADVMPEDIPCNYEGVSSLFLPMPMTVTITGAFMVAMFAQSMSYMLFIATSVAPILANWKIGKETDLKHALMCVTGFFIILPLSLLRDISKLKATSILGTLTLMFSAAYVAVCGYTHVHSYGPADSFQSINLSYNTAVCATMTFSAFSCHVSTMPIYKSLGPTRSRRVMLIVLFVSLSVAAVLYQAVGVAGYMRFGDNVKGNILESFADAHAHAVTVPLLLANVGVPFNLVTSMPVIMWPLRSCTITSVRALTGRPATTEPALGEWWITTFLLISAIILAAICVPDIKTVMGLGSAVGTAFIVFIYPSAFYLAAVKQVKPSDWMQIQHLPQLAMMGVGAVAGIMSFTVGIMRVLQD